MKLFADHTFAGITQSDYEALFFDDAFNVALCAAVKLEREVLKFDRTESRIVRHVRCTPARELPGPVAKLLGGKRLSYVEELEYDVGKFHGRWRTLPNVAADKVDSSGTIEFAAAPGGMKRIVRGEIKVSVFGIGGIIEKFIMSDVEKSYDDAAAFTNDWVAKHKK